MSHDYVEIDDKCVSEAVLEEMYDVCQQRAQVRRNVYDIVSNPNCRVRKIIGKAVTVGLLAGQLYNSHTTLFRVFGVLRIAATVMCADTRASHASHVSHVLSNGTKNPQE